MNPETKLQRQIMLALSEAGCTIWRNEVAGAWLGRVIHRERDTVTLAGARMTTFGLAVGSSDLIGLAPCGRLLAVEVKTSKGRPTLDQLRFIDAVNAAGGIAGIARSVQDALQLINQKQLGCGP